jgi:hypothetical protein
MNRHRRAIVWACIAAAVLLGLQAQLHGLSHAVQALQEVQASASQEPLAAHAQPCDQCLLFAALDGAAPAPAAGLPAVATDQTACTAPALPLRAAAFAAYASRAPPGLG